MKKMKRKIYLIGCEPELVVYGDIGAVFSATELRASCNLSIEPKSDAIRMYFLGGSIAENMPLEIPPEARFVYEDNDIFLKSHGVYRYGDWYGKARSVVDLAHRQAVIVLPGLTKLNKDFVSRFIFRPVLDSLLSASGFIPFHAAGVVSPDGGCVISGPAGAGKTSLVKGLVECGFQFMADDRVLIKEAAKSGLHMYAFPEYIRYAVSSHASKRMISPADAVEKKVPVTHIIFLDGYGTNDAISLEEISKAEAAAKLMHFISSNMEPQFYRRAFKITGDICSGCRTYALKGWGDPGGWVRTVAAMLNGE